MISNRRNAMRFRHFNIAVLSILIATNFVIGAERPAPPNSEELTKKYSDAFRDNGVPTPGAVDASFKQAETTNTIESWLAAAKLANSYADVVGVLKEHYAKLFDASEASGVPQHEYLSTAVEYEKKQNEFLGKRNDAYIKISRLYLAQGDKAHALSFAVASVELSASEPNKEGEDLIRQIIEYAP